MAIIRNFGLVRHLRAETTTFVLRFRNGRLLRSGRALGFWFVPLSTSIAEVPIDDQEITFLFHARTADFQDVSVQGAVAYRVLEPEKLAERVDFSIDVLRGSWLKKPLETLAQLVTQLAQQYAVGWLGEQVLRVALTAGPTLLRQRLEERLMADESLRAVGLHITSARVAGVAPLPELVRALEAPMRERIQQEADEAGFQRRALAVEKERAIQENELNNQLELARREEALIGQRGVNEQRRVEDAVKAARVEAEAGAARDTLHAETQAAAVRVVEGAKVDAERARMTIYREMPADVLLGLAARELATKLQKIEHVRVEPNTVADWLAGFRSGILPQKARDR